MTLTKDEWLDLIADPMTEKRGAGTRLVVPAAGDRVIVRRGLDVGQTFTVVCVRGHVYRLDQRIFVDHPSDIPTWYHPWDLEIVPPGGSENDPTA